MLSSLSGHFCFTVGNGRSILANAQEDPIEGEDDDADVVVENDEDEETDDSMIVTDSENDEVLAYFLE